ncbi:phage protease [Gemmobacter sp.]|uniref:phage protease n=1 Tax=Gemmobacter sp. TaxID=1898957 RepID=UPI002AFFAEBE|nr:phage protease [Gemmobacter sp.]
MSGLASAICDRALAPGGGAPEWVHLFPSGFMTGRDGRQFDLGDPQALIREFRSRGVDLPIDYEHQNDRPEASISGPVPAAGWIKDLKADETGLWGRVEWTATAREMIGRREYRYLSPSFLFDPKTLRIARLKGAGLVHSPNLHLTALASEETTMPDAEMTRRRVAGADLLQKLALALGLPPDSDASEILATILGASTPDAETDKATAREAPDPARFVPIAAVQELMADRNTRIATMRESEARASVKLALRNGHITPAMRGWATALCQQDPESFERFIATSPAPYAHLHRPVQVGQIEGAAPAVSREEASVCAQLGLKPGSLRG